MDNTRIVLIEKFLDDVLSQDEAREILALLDEDKEFADELMNSVRVKGNIMSAVHEDRECEQLAHIVEVALGPSDDRGSFESRVIQRLQKRRTRRKKWRIHLTAAAVFLILAAGAYVFNLYRMSGKYAGNIAEVYGKVHIERNGAKIPAEKGMAVLSEDTVVTGGDSLCRVDSGSIVALNESTELVFHADRHGLNSLTYRKGQVFADIHRRGTKLSVTIGKSTLTVLGTQFQIRPSDTLGRPVVDVFKGTVKLAQGTLGTYIDAGHSGLIYLHGGILVKYTDTRETARTGKRLKVFVPPADNIPVAWLRKVGCFYRELLSAYRSKTSTSPIDFDAYVIYNGIWKIKQHDTGTVITQELSGAVDTDILFGKPEWKKSTVSVDFRVNKYIPGDCQKRVAILFFYKSGSYDCFGLSEQLKRLRRAGYTGWVNLKINFKVTGAEDTIDIRMYADPLPGVEKGKHFRYRKGPGNSEYPFERKIVGIGLKCSGVSAEFKNLKIVPR